FDQLRNRGATVARPDLTFGIADHYVPTRPASSAANTEAAGMIEQLARNAREHGILSFGQFDQRQGIVHVAIPEQGLTLPGLSIVGRMTLCKLSIEAGGRLGLIAPDQTTFDYVRGLPFAPRGDGLERAIDDWRLLASDADAAFDREVVLDASEIAPVVTWGT